MANLGEMLSAARQQRGLPIDEVARRTRIRADYIAALEQNQFSVLPGDVYARGFVRNYALLLGIPSDEAIAAYEETAAPPKRRSLIGTTSPSRREPDPIRIEPLSPTPVDTRLRYAPSFWLVSALAVVLIIGFYFAFNTLNPSTEGLPTPTQQPPTPTQLDLPVVVVSNTPVRTPWATPGGVGEVVASPTSGQAAQPGDTGATPVAGDPGAQPTATTAPQPAEPTPAPPTATATSVPSGLTVDVEIQSGRSDAWVRVETDGRIVFQQTLAAGSKRSWTAGQTVRIRTGRADLVRVAVNGVDKGYMGGPNQMIVTKEWDAAGNERVIANQ